MAPHSGLEVNGIFIPGGTIVGVSAWALHAKEDVFGTKTEEFRPERWLEVKESERKRMENALFTFGYGSRSCIEKNISLLEIYKVVPTLLLKFEVSVLGSAPLYLLGDATSSLRANRLIFSSSNSQIRKRTGNCSMVSSLKRQGLRSH